MSLAALLIEIPSEALHLHNGDQPNNCMPFRMSSSCSCAKLLYRLPRQAHFLKCLDYSAIEGHWDPRFVVQKEMFVE